MKLSHLVLPLLASVQLLAAADESALLLQKALFEEEANHDLDAAVKAYQAVVADADAQRSWPPPPSSASANATASWAAPMTRFRNISAFSINSATRPISSP
jgi:hypothetical protein